MSTGMTFDQVRKQFDLPRLRAMQNYWEGNPPVHIMIARYFDIKPKVKEAELSNEEQLIRLMSAFGQG